MHLSPVDMFAVSRASPEHGGRVAAGLRRRRSRRKLLRDERQPVVADGSVWIRPRASTHLRVQRQRVQRGKPVAAVQPQ